MTKQQELIPQLFRTEFRKIVSVLCRRFGFDQIEIAEDMVSDTFLAASETWELKGVPPNPTAWLYHVAKNKAKNYLQRGSIFENKIIPALKAGFVVLADRYIYTLIARSSARGLNKSWLYKLFSFAVEPDLVFYLDVDPYNLIHRVFQKNYSLDYYESGLDIGISNDIFDSFIKYQTMLRKEFENIGTKYNLINVDGNKDIHTIYNQIQSKVDAFLN